MVGVAFPPCETTIVDIAVLLFAAIGVVGAFGSAFGTVNVIVAVATPSTADESHGAGALGAVGLLVHTQGPPLNPPPCFLLDQLAVRPFDRTGAVQRIEVSCVMGVERILSVAHVSDVLRVMNLGWAGI